MLRPALTNKFVFFLICCCYALCILLNIRATTFSIILGDVRELFLSTPQVLSIEVLGFAENVSTVTSGVVLLVP